MWVDAIAKEITNVWVVFNILEDGRQGLMQYQFVKCHMIFDVKIRLLPEAKADHKKHDRNTHNGDV